MTNATAVQDLKEIKTFLSAKQLDSIDYAIDVLERLERAGIKEPLETDFSACKDAGGGL